MTEPIDLYVFGLEPGRDRVKTLARVLNESERARASRLFSEEAGDRFRVARGMLRHVLASYLGDTPNELRFSYGPHGKPALVPREGTSAGKTRGREPGAPVFFNLSHSGGFGAIVVSRSFDVGVDIEVWRETHDGLADRFFSREESRALSALSEPDRTAAFFRCWTRKEAVIKTSGDGFSRPLASFDVSITDVVSPELLRIEGDGETREDWQLFSFAPAHNVSGAVACRNRGAPVSLCRREFVF